MKYCRFLNFSFSPLRPDINVLEYLYDLHKEKQNICRINFRDINVEFLSLLNRKKLYLTHAESFYKPPSSRNSYPHLDSFPGDIVKINWIYHGQDSTMNWLSLLPGKSLIKSVTSINTTFYHANEYDTVIEESCFLHSPSLVQVGVLHNISNHKEDRYCLSFCISDKLTRKFVGFDKAKEVLEEYII